jgi:hypothetical protein
MKTTIICCNREISSEELFAETWPKMTFLAKCVFLMANNLEQEQVILMEYYLKCAVHAFVVQNKV